MRAAGGLQRGQRVGDELLPAEDCDLVLGEAFAFVRTQGERRRSGMMFELMLSGVAPFTTESTSTSRTEAALALSSSVWARATDMNGVSQPPVTPGWNPRGYGNNIIHRIALFAK